MLIPPFAGFVLAGGQSTRMGTNKALLKLGGETLVERGLRVMGEVCAEVAIAGGGPELERFGRVIRDEVKGCGPLSGLVAALEQSAYEWNAFVPVDVPFVPSSVWTHLMAWADGSEAGSVWVQVNGVEQPLCGVYARAIAPSLRKSLAAGQLKVSSALALAGPVHLVKFTESDWFRNVNTPEEFAGLEFGHGSSATRQGAVS